jgi:U4/U6 small nuclear ribonucleoprotein PRP31
VWFVLSSADNDVDASDMDEDVDGHLGDLENLNYDHLDSVSKLYQTQRYVDIM